ncbi:MAG: translation initiation factor IF-2 subunit beta [Nitrososphaeria archaeon]|nr:translation initiation factor IF-2 subunit beta [Aigarchaeota archaeon]MCX8187341.1 translation initiation factor IF-2 subunit beta [Nitrososphaeria archaeon]MDW8021125.1 translation initiation factor IF-2 subunit beta [Nitrososphaerota archaeon]
MSWEELIKTKEGYLRILEDVMSRVPQTIGKIGDRLIVLNPEILHEARRTMIMNFKEMAEKLNRDPQHLARFIFKESGKPGSLESERLIIQGKFTNEEFKRLIELYVKEFVKCPICGGLDTKIVSEKRLRFLVCEICGAKSSLRKI